MFLCQPLLDVLIERGIEDVDGFLQAPSWSDLPDPMSMASMESAVERVLRAVKEGERIAIHGDYDCDGVLGTHILRTVLASLGAQARPYLPHRDEGYGLNSKAVHQFSMSGTDLLITVDNGINARLAIRLAQRLGIEVIVIDHHRVQESADTLAIWSQDFCGAGLAAMFSWALALRTGWKESRIERLLAGISQYAAIASIADCVPLRNGTRTWARLGMRELGRAEHCGLRELLRISCSDPASPDSYDIGFGVGPRINAAGRLDHPALALAVFNAALDKGAAGQAVQTLDRLNAERRRQVAVQFDELAGSLSNGAPAAIVAFREACPRGIAGLLASKCVERYSVPSIVLTPAPDPGFVVGSGRSLPGLDLVEALDPFKRLLTRFGGHAQAVGLTMALEHVETFQQKFNEAVGALKLPRQFPVKAEAQLSLAMIGKNFDQQIAVLEPFGEGNPAPVFELRMVEIVSVRNRWVRLRQGRRSVEVLCWDSPQSSGARGECLVEFRGKRRFLREFREQNQACARAI
jgi:single-stranded-DNA-specific exonuclease